MRKKTCMFIAAIGLMMILPGAITLGHILLQARRESVRVEYKPKAHTDTLVRLRVGPYSIGANHLVGPLAIAGSVLFIIGLTGAIRSIRHKNTEHRP